MGDGKRLKEIIASKGTNVRKVAKATQISASTLYTIIQRDSNLRFDYALRIANELGIDVNEICSANPFSEESIKEDEIYISFNDKWGILDENRVKVYLKGSMLPLMRLYGKNAMPDVDNLLTSFYQLNDNARAEVVELVKMKLKYQTDPDRVQEIKNIKRW